jgi:hypothetical protein
VEVNESKKEKAVFAIVRFLASSCHGRHYLTEIVEDQICVVSCFGFDFQLNDAG